MPNKPTHQDLLKRIKTLEKEAEGRRKVEEELREGREHLRSLMESASNFAVYRLVHDPENPFKLGVVFVSPSLKDILGLADPHHFETWFANMHPGDVERMVAANLKAFETFRFNEIYRTFHAPSGEWRWIHAISTGVLDQAKQTRYVNGIIIDVSAQKKAEAALQEAYRTLDQKVKERTTQIQAANQRLRKEIEERKQVEETLKISREKLRLLSNRLIATQERERKLLAFELHDELGQILVGLKFQFFSLRHRLGGPAHPLWNAIEETCGHLDQATDKVRRLSRQLSPTTLEHLGLAETLRQLFQEFAHHHGLLVKNELEVLAGLLSYVQEVNVYRIFQEALTNIKKHARSKTASVGTEIRPDRVVFSIEDDGLGFDRSRRTPKKPADPGLGLIIMEERARMAGGSLVIQSRKNKGTRITLEIPRR